jgi:HAMP domain-containing protein
MIVTVLTREHAFAVRVPIARNGATVSVLSGVISPRAISRLLDAQRLPADWVGVVLDGNQRIVARTVEPERSVGQMASASLRAALSRAPEGWFQGSTIEGTRVYTPYNRSLFSGWTVAMGIPAAAVEAAGWRTISTLIAGVLAAIGIAGLLALALSRWIAAPVMALAAAAKAIGRGDRPDIVRSGRVEEVGEVAHALEDAATAVRARGDSRPARGARRRFE